MTTPDDPDLFRNFRISTSRARPEAPPLLMMLLLLLLPKRHFAFSVLLGSPQ